MYNYPVTDANGRTMGVISLEKEEVAKLMMEGFGFELGGLWNHTTKDFISFTIIPKAAVEADTKPDTYTIDSHEDVDHYGTVVVKVSWGNEEIARKEFNKFTDKLEDIEIWTHKITKEHRAKRFPPVPGRF